MELFIFVRIIMIIAITTVKNKAANSHPLELTEIQQNSSGAINLDTYNSDLTSEVVKKIQECDKDLDTMALCMRCAKITKSPIVYPMCCDNEDKTKDWCYKYINFGISK